MLREGKRKKRQKKKAEETSLKFLRFQIILSDKAQCNQLLLNLKLQHNQLLVMNSPINHLSFLLFNILVFTHRIQNCSFHYPIVISIGVSSFTFTAAHIQYSSICFLFIYLYLLDCIYLFDSISVLNCLIIFYENGSSYPWTIYANMGSTPFVYPNRLWEKSSKVQE